MLSSATLTVSPTATSISPSSLRNCSIGTMPSDLSPALMTTTSVRTSPTTPLTMAPGLSLARLVWLCSNSSEPGRAHVCTPVPNAHLVFRLLLEKQHTRQRYHIPATTITH